MWSSQNVLQQQRVKWGDRRGKQGHLKQECFSAPRVPVEFAEMKEQVIALW